MTGLEIRDLTKSFRSTPVLRGVNLDVPSGELTAILGPSGCGKTTLLRLIAGFDAPDSGRITLDGAVLADGAHTVPPERRGVGYVAQEGALFPHLSVARNIAFGLPGSTRRHRRRIDELLELVGLENGYADRSPDQLSGGQQQRVALARALAPEPAVVLLDEPFAALDAALRSETRTAVVAALAESAATAILVTHDQTEALSVAAQVAVLRDGVVAQAGDPVELYTNPLDPALAEFVGAATMLDVIEQLGDQRVRCALGVVAIRPPMIDVPARVMIRPEQLRLEPITNEPVPSEPHGTNARVTARTFYGHDAAVTLKLSGTDVAVVARCASHAMPDVGRDVVVTVDGGVLAFGPPPNP